MAETIVLEYGERLLFVLIGKELDHGPILESAILKDS